jgi:hypothetical protein
MSQDQEPHINLNQAHDETTYERSLIPDTVYRLRFSVLKDGHVQLNCPSQMFVSFILPSSTKLTNDFVVQTFDSLVTLDTATKTILHLFGSGLSAYEMEKSGVLEEAQGTEDGRTEDLTVQYDSVNADESWDEFLRRVKDVGKQWYKEAWVSCEEKSYGRQVVRGVEVPECS